MSRRIISKIRFYCSVSALYALTLLFVVQAFGVQLFQNIEPSPTLQALAPAPEPPEPEIKIISAKPTRIVIPRLAIDLPISDGTYDPQKKTWTLSDNHAHYALPSMVPNDFEGNTLIYGHKYDWVFGGLPDLQPGDTMQLFGDSGHVFTYVYQSTEKLTPEDNSVFRYDGAPTVSVQTCSGRWNEVRQMFNFKLDKVT
ncbi:MAG: class F sortase [Candidatus Saccharimonadales bacterium]